jgi:hypothetical protein
VKPGSFSWGGQSSVEVEAADHDFGDKGSLQYWNGMLLTDVETTIKIAENMTWKGKHPVVTRMYEKGVKLTKKAMAAYEKVINRKQGLEDWFVDISPSPT